MGGGKGKKFMEMMGEKGGKMPDMMAKPSKPGMGKTSKPGMGKGKPPKGEMVQQMMAEKSGLCLSQDEVHVICGMGTNLQRKMDAALKQCMPMEMMAATMDDMQDMSMSPDTKLLSSGRAFDFEEVSDRGMKKKAKKVMKKSGGKKGKRPSKKAPKKPSKNSKKPSKKAPKKPSKSKKPSKGQKPSMKPSEFQSCEDSCPSMDEMKASAMEEMETELCILNAIGWIDDKGNMKQDVEDVDMAEFPAAVKEAVSEAKIKDCAEVATAKKMESMMESKEFQQKYGGCFTNQCHSEKEMGAMTEMMEMMAGMQCWDKAFTKACQGHIKENLLSMASNMLAGR